jgi:hypothetical protein
MIANASHAVKAGMHVDGAVELIIQLFATCGFLSTVVPEADKRDCGCRRGRRERETERERESD